MPEITKNPNLTDRNLHLIQFKSCSVFAGVGVVIWFNIPFIIIFLSFWKILILKLKTFLKINLLLSWNSAKLRKNVGNIQFIWKEMEINFGFKRWRSSKKIWETLVEKKINIFLKNWSGILIYGQYCTCECKCSCIIRGVCANIPIYIYIYIYTHTHTHTHTGVCV